MAGLIISLTERHRRLPGDSLSVPCSDQGAGSPRKELPARSLTPLRGDDILSDGAGIDLGAGLPSTSK